MKERDFIQIYINKLHQDFNQFFNIVCHDTNWILIYIFKIFNQSKTITKSCWQLDFLCVHFIILSTSWLKNLATCHVQKGNMNIFSKLYHFPKFCSVSYQFWYSKKKVLLCFICQFMFPKTLSNEPIFHVPRLTNFNIANKLLN